MSLIGGGRGATWGTTLLAAFSAHCISSTADADAVAYLGVGLDVKPDEVAGKFGLVNLGLTDERTNTYVIGSANGIDDAAMGGIRSTPGVTYISDLPPWAASSSPGAGANPHVALAATPEPSVPKDIVEQLSITFEQCMDTLGNAPRPKLLRRPLQWIHIPKCGTSFGAVIHGYVCQPEEAPYTNPNPRPNHPTNNNCTYCGDRNNKEGKHLSNGMWWDPKLRNLIPFSDKFWKGHRHRWHEYYAPHCDWSQTVHPPYSNHFSLDRRSPSPNDVFVLLRDPRKRLVSSWNNNKHSYGIGGVRHEINECQTLQEFVQHRGIPGCQTKMLLGRTCATTWQLAEKDYLEAEKRLDGDIKFIGLTDAFNASVCLFHHMFGGEPLPYMFQTVGRERSSDFLFKEYKNTKKYKPLPGGGDRVPSSAWQTVSLKQEPHDARLYKKGRAVFIARLKQYGLFDKFVPAGAQLTDEIPLEHVPM